MTDTSVPPRTWWVWTLVGIGVAGLVAFAIVLTLTVAPPVMANLRSEVATGQTIALEDEGMSASVAVPEGWLIVRQDDGAVVVSTPDRGLIAEMTLTGAEPAAAAEFEGIADPLIEPLASGLTLAQGAPATGEATLVVAVGPVSGGSVLIAVTADDVAAYRPALAELVEAIAP